MTSLISSLHRPCVLICSAAFSLLAITSHAQTSESGYQVIVSPANSLNYTFKDVQSGNTLLEIGLMAWSPNWAFAGQPTSKDKATGDHLVAGGSVTFKDGGIINIHVDALPSSKSAVTYTYTLTAEKDVATTCIAAPILMPSGSAAIHSMTITTGGKDTDMSLPPDSQAEIPATSKVVFHADGGDITMEINPPSTISYQASGIRLLLAENTFKTGTTTTAVTYTFSKPAAYLASDEALAQFSQPVATGSWFPWVANDHTSPCVFAMDDWLDKPAGKHGGVRMDGDQFKLEDGTPIKFWGTNLAYLGCAPEHAVAEDAAARFARYGVNAVRLHKFSGPGWQGIGDPNDAAQFEPKGLEKFDYFTSQLKNHGVYFGFSHTFGMLVRPGNKAQLAGYDEIVNNLKGSTLGLVNYSEDVQDLLIQSVVNLLTHTNPYTGKTYAEEPALNYIELQNEDDIFWYQTGSTYSKCPTYAKLLRERFTDWLKKKYGTQETLAKVWGDGLDDKSVTLNVNVKETIEAKNINVIMNPYFFGEKALGQDNPGAKQRAFDTASFLHEMQDQFYSKFVKAIRTAGYKGPICGSPWFAPAMMPEYYNLFSDYEAGFIDRHNYFGVDNVFETMLTKPGSGYLSSGLQQVEGRPFGLSEWITQFPIEYQAEGPVIMAAYGLGLQGWDSSYEFNSSPQYKGGAWFAQSAGGLPFARWNVDSPVQIGQFPALARMISRGDVQQGDVISTRRTSLDEISHDTFSFSTTGQQLGDIKTLGGTCPPEALAAGRCLIQFTDTPQPSVEPDMTKYKKGTVITSTTGELVWDSMDKGFFTINTAGTKAVVGFASGKEQKLGNITITSRSPYASIILTALDQHATLDNTKSALLTVVARAVSTGFTVNTLNNHMLNPGGSPLLVEPVQADITINNRAVSAVNVLSQNGALTQKTVPVQNNAFHIDSTNDQTLYYQVVFK